MSEKVAAMERYLATQGLMVVEEERYRSLESAYEQNAHQLEQAYGRLHDYETVLGDAWADLFRLISMHEDAYQTGWCDECGFAYPYRTARVLHRTEVT